MNLRTLISRHLNRKADMQRRRAERQQRRDPLADYVDMTPAMWDALSGCDSFTASTPQPAERELPPQRRYSRVAWNSLDIGGPVTDAPDASLN